MTVDDLIWHATPVVTRQPQVVMCAYLCLYLGVYDRAATHVTGANERQQKEPMNPVKQLHIPVLKSQVPELLQYVYSLTSAWAGGGAVSWARNNDRLNLPNRTNRQKGSAPSPCTWRYSGTPAQTTQRMRRDAGRLAFEIFISWHQLTPLVRQ